MHKFASNHVWMIFNEKQTQKYGKYYEKNLSYSLQFSCRHNGWSTVGGLLCRDMVKGRKRHKACFELWAKES